MVASAVVILGSRQRLTSGKTPALDPPDGQNPPSGIYFSGVPVVVMEELNFGFAFYS